ncbi:DegT/DnrJ/EryC1/StrS family aminotransferase [Ensifer sp. ENS09]|uniref:DegT/DnrJ/EryC1/StrS family aminotransferase n=1 Tax=Ensifer sp. ENS09 TaxID=2769263 RepID=UPI0017868861|nr:DegT/DnrJ/EryC1/StrS family aminotransferase [Ensifer sp. ENS09]MBD9653009.1 DegT/DnrJ/EryC1/StrS family aminotransferase [Ensifer sp. ENS09]
MSNTVKFLELGRLNDRYWPEFMVTAERTIKSGSYIGGDEVTGFEREFADYCGSKYCVGVGNGLDALVLALRALGVTAGDEVIVPGQTFIATWLAVTAVGAKIVPVDVEEDSANVDASKIEAAITPRTKAIIPVHLYGATAGMAEIMRIARLRDIYVVEDAAQAHGHVRFGKRAGTHGHVGCFSFYPSKNLGALGDGGGIVTDDETIAKRVRLLANYGSTEKYVHQECGTNSRLDPIQAAFLRLKLQNLDWIAERRKQIADVYSEALRRNSSSVRRLLGESYDSVWHNFVVVADDREHLVAHLRKHGIETALHYPLIPSLQACYRDEFATATLPISKSLSERSLSLPIGEYLELEEVTRVADALRQYEGK